MQRSHGVCEGKVICAAGAAAQPIQNQIARNR
jgi:hypothetical protein